MRPSQPVLFVREEYAQLLLNVLAPPFIRVSNRAELTAVIRECPSALAFIDVELLPQIEAPMHGGPIVGITDGGVTELVQALLAFPKLSTIASTAMLGGPHAVSILQEITTRTLEQHGVLSRSAIARSALLASSHRRVARLERVADFFAGQDVHPKTIETITDVAEELLSNALYDAPREAGYFSAPMSRTSTVELPPEMACEIRYGIDRDRLFVRVRDPFGALTRQRLLDVLERCRRKEVPFDESRGGAGLGMWRVFSAASSITVHVIPGRLTDILVWIDRSTRRPSGKLHAVKMLFPHETVLQAVAGRFAADHDFDLMDDSFTALISS